MSALPALVLCLALAVAVPSTAKPGRATAVDSRMPTAAMPLATVGLFEPRLAGPRLGVSAGHTTRPNIVLITTDDQRADDIRFMPRVRDLIGDQGTAFQGISPHPLCCPARAQILSGQMAHNNGVRSNQGPFGGYPALQRRETVAVWLRRAGYATSFLGKHLNGYELQRPSPVDPGWSSWHALTRNLLDYWHFSVNHNGRVRRSHGIYQTDYFTQLAAKEIRRLSTRHRPFFLWQSYIAPHRRYVDGVFGPPDAAPRHAELFADARLPSRDSSAFNETDLSDKPPGIRDLPRLSRAKILALRHWHRQRLRSLRAVDEGVEKIVQALRRAGELQRTLIIFTSDNGILLGEHRFTWKDVPYEEALRVPLLMRGPGVPANHRAAEVGTTVDIAATILAATGATPSVPIDGRNLRRLARREMPSSPTVLIQSGPQRPGQHDEGWNFRGVRTPRYTYVHYPWAMEEELYDRLRDPYQLRSLHRSGTYADVRRELSRRLALLADCAGPTCWQRFAPLPPPDF